MPVPTAITDLSTTAASNSPAGSDNPFPDLDDYLRAHGAFIAQNYAATQALDTEKLDLAGGTMTGALTLNANAVNNLHAVPKQQLDSGLAGKANTSHSHAWADISSKGLAEGAISQDPNTTQAHVSLTNHANGPDAGANYWYITTTFYSTLTGNRAQVAVCYTSNLVYARSFAGAWTAWARLDNAEALTRSLAATGYQKLPGGLILQWGTVGATQVTFPIAFPTAVLNAIAQVQAYPVNVNTNYVAMNSLTTTGFTRPDSTYSIRYIAIGY